MFTFYNGTIKLIKYIIFHDRAFKIKKKSGGRRFKNMIHEKNRT